MNFSLPHIGTDNFFVGDFNAVTFSLFGMLLVFSGLAIISLYIAFLPRFLHFIDKRKRGGQAKEGNGVLEESPAEKEILLAIAAAFHLDQNFPEENQKITWKSHGDVDSLWQISGRVQGMSQRTHVSRRVFPHH